MAVSLVFQGSGIEEVNEAILAYCVTANAPSPSTVEEPEKKAAPAKKKTKAKAKVHDKVETDSHEGVTRVGEAPEDPMDLFGDDDPAPEDPAAGEEDDPFGSTDPTIEDVKNALGEVVSAWDEKDNTGAEKAQKVLQVYGESDDLGGLGVSLYRTVIEKSNLLVEKANG